MKNKKTRMNVIAVTAVILIYVVIFFALEGGMLSRHYQSLLVPIGINIVLAVSLNLTTGFLGELTLGHAGFMSVGAYAGSLFALYASQSGKLPDLLVYLIAMLIGGLAAALCGVIIGVPVLRLKGDYLAIVTLAFGEIIRSIITNMKITGGAAGLTQIPRYSNIKNPTNYNYITTYVIVICTILLIKNLVDSRHGRAIRSIREDFIASESVGIKTTYYKILAFASAAFFAGVAGVMYGCQNGILKATDFDYNKSIEILVIVVLGGMGSIRGSVISAIIITLLPEVLRGLDDYRMLIYAVVLIAMMLFNASRLKIWMKNYCQNHFKRPVAGERKGGN